MSAARVQNNFSNRAKTRLAVERKAVFRSVLENPFQIKWPSVPTNLQNICLARLLASLESHYHKRACPPRVQNTCSGNTLPPAHNSHEMDQVSGLDLNEYPVHGVIATGAVSTSSGERDHNLIVGINQVTRALECQIQSMRRLAVIPHLAQPDPSVEPPPLAVVFACSADIEPLILVEHIPHLVAACNSFHSISKRQLNKVKLVPLPKSSESVVAQAVGLRRAAVIGIYIVYRRTVPCSYLFKMY
ncbi:hypothetical protein V8B97DRAFT_1674663 [Scleroderma yunnanense]